MSPAFALACVLMQAPDFVEQGRAALSAHHDEEAAGLFRKAVAANPSDYAAHFHLALAESLLNHDEEASTEYRKTLELQPKLYQAELNLGILLVRDKKPTEAVPLLTDAVSQKAGEYRPNLYLGQALLDSGQAKQAVPAFQAAVQISQKAPAELGLAHALLAGGDLDAAIPHFQKAAELDPDYKSNLLEVAQAEEKTGRKADAIAIYRQFPQDTAAQERLGELQIETGEAAAAIPNLERAVKDSPTPANRLALAQAYRETKQTEKQNEQLKRAVAAAPSDYSLRVFYGRALRDQRQFPPAAEQFLAAAKLKPDSAEAWNELAGVLIMNENFAEGLTALDKVRALGAEKPGDIYLRAITLDKIHALPQALQSYRQFLAVAGGKYPDQEFLARQRARIIDSELHKR